MGSVAQIMRVPDNRDVVEELRRHRRPPWHRDPFCWLAILAVLIGLVALFRDYLGWQYKPATPSNTVETMQAVKSAAPIE
jgi:hypothetical protein